MWMQIWNLSTKDIKDGQQAYWMCVENTRGWFQVWEQFFQCIQAMKGVVPCI